MLYGREAMGAAHTVWQERCLADTLRHIALVGGEEQDMLEIKASGLKHSHYLYTLNRLTMVWDRR